MSSEADQPISPAHDTPNDSLTSTPAKVRSKRAASKSKATSAAKRLKKASSPEDSSPPADDSGVLELASEDQHPAQAASRAPSFNKGSPLSEETMGDNSEGHAGRSSPPWNSDDQAPTSPPPGNSHPDFHDVNYVPYSDLERLVAFAQKVDEENNRFAVSRIPNRASWGTTSTTDRIYCNDNRPVTYWLLGVVGSKWFTNFKGEPQLRVNIGLRLPYKDDDSFAKKIYKLARPPKKDEDIPELVYASKYMARHVRGSPDAVATPFNEVYDAQRRFRSKREMCIIPPAYISKHDLVLVEAFLTRWNTAKDKKAKAEWTSWDVGFELQAVSLLFEAPPLADEPEYGPADNICDDM